MIANVLMGHKEEKNKSIYCILHFWKDKFFLRIYKAIYFHGWILDIIASKLIEKYLSSWLSIKSSRLLPKKQEKRNGI